MTPRIGMVPRAVTLIPLAALSAVWTVSIVRTPAAEISSVAGSSAQRAPSSTSSTSTITPPATPTLPDAALVLPPNTQAPASVWGGAGRGSLNAVSAAQTMSSQAIPAIALAAYQRAATVIDTADRACHLDWSLLAAIGRIESDHGSHAGSQLSATGLATPGIVGPALTGLGGTALMKDTDAGRLDGDTRYDHAVGPMQFLPSTWAVVGVDADGDGQRNPQDIDDAALAAGVYLCSGAEDLSTDAGRQAALLRYNHSASYVSTVMSVAASYQSGAGVDTGLGGLVATRAMGVVPAVVVEPASEPAEGKKRPKHHAHHSVASVTGPATHASHGGGHVAPTPPTPPAGEPTAPPSDGTTDPGEGTTTPPPVTAASDEDLRGLCTPAIDEEYPTAKDDAALHEKAVTTCIADLRASGEDVTLEDAQGELDHVVANLAGKIDGLVPPTGEPSPTDGPTTDPSPSPSESPSGSDSSSSGATSGASDSASDGASDSASGAAS